MTTSNDFPYLHTDSTLPPAYLSPSLPNHSHSHSHSHSHTPSNNEHTSPVGDTTTSLPPPPATQPTEELPNLPDIPAFALLFLIILTTGFTAYHIIHSILGPLPAASSSSSSASKLLSNVSFMHVLLCSLPLACLIPKYWSTLTGPSDSTEESLELLHHCDRRDPSPHPEQEIVDEERARRRPLSDSSRTRQKLEHERIWIWRMWVALWVLGQFWMMRAILVWMEVGSGNGGQACHGNELPCQSGNRTGCGS